MKTLENEDIQEINSTLMDKIAILIKRLVLVFDKMAIPLLAPYDLTPTQYKVIKYLLRHQGEDIRQRDIERAYSLTNPTVTGVLKNLEKNGWVIRVTNEKDARSKLIRLTDKTLGMEKELYAIGEQLEKMFTKGLNGEEREQLRSLLQKLLHTASEE